MDNIVYFDASRVTQWEKCPRSRFWLYHALGTGLARADALKLDARIGTWVHNGIEKGLLCGAHGLERSATIENVKQIALWAGNEFLDECRKVTNNETLSDQLSHDIVEGSRIVTALTYAWLRVKAPRMMADGKVLAIEKELTVDFRVGSNVVRLMARTDVIWRRRQDGTIFIRNLKTVRNPKDQWREKWALDMQTLSEPLAVDEWLRRNVEGSQPDDACGGVIIDGLVTGEVLFDKYRGVFYHNNPLIYAWEGGDIGIVDHPVFYPRYEWSCTGPHKFANGRKCEGGKTHKLSGVKKVAVADRYPGGIIGWIDYLIDNDIALIEEMLIELPPIIRSEYQIERWKRQVLPREVAIRHKSNICNTAHENSVPIDEHDTFDAHLDANFPMHTANGNCLYPSQCPAHSLCHGSAAADPLNSGYSYRIANHPIEQENKK